MVSPRPKIKINTSPDHVLLKLKVILTVKSGNSSIVIKKLKNIIKG
jgi:hypothetical protein